MQLKDFDQLPSSARIRIGDACKLLTISRVSFHRKVVAGDLPKPVSVAGGRPTLSVGQVREVLGVAA